METARMVNFAYKNFKKHTQLTQHDKSKCEQTILLAYRKFFHNYIFRSVSEVITKKQSVFSPLFEIVCRNNFFALYSLPELPVSVLAHLFF